MASRGEHLVRGDRAFITGHGLVGKIAAPAFQSMLDQWHERLAVGGIDGLLPDGTRRKIGFHAPGPEAVVNLHSWTALARVAFSGSVGLYKAWEKGEWSAPDPVPLFALFMANAKTLGGTARAKGPARWLNAAAHALRDNGLVKARENIAAHYDLGNDFYAAWLDPSMSYSSARFDVSDELEVAQLRKVELLLDRLDLKPGDRMLEIGCGWGTLAIQAAKRGVNVVGLTLSSEQQRFSEKKVASCKLEHLVEIRLQDYRQISEQFDAIASVEMVEAVGQRWWPAYLDAIADNLKPGGRAALQYISIDHALFDDYAASADFIQTYIFPGGMLIDEPTFASLAVERGLNWEGHEAFGLDYARTLAIWRERYDAAVARGLLSDFSERFHRLWRFYLMYCEGGFRGGGIEVAQITMRKVA